MKHILTISLCFLALSLSAQENITYPYNPDGDADGLVAVPDIQDLLAVYGNPFSPAEIMVGDTALSEWIQILYQALQDQQDIIDAMQGADGCDTRFPDGLDGDYFTDLLRDNDMNDYPYTVPIGKTLYVTSVYAGGSSGSLYITNNNGGSSEILLGSNFGSNDIGRMSLHNPIILDEGQTIYGYGNPGLSVAINGFVINSGVNPITWNGGSYQVPENKKLYVTNIRGDISIDGILLAKQTGNTYALGYPIVINSTQVVSVGGSGSVNDGGTVNGYLVDEDYFADCGGGGSSEGEGTDGLTLQNCNNQTTITYYEYEYDLIGIGDQCWFAENLRAKNFNNGEPITQGILANDNDYYLDGLDPKGFDYPCLPLNGSADGDILAEEWFGLMYSGFCAIDNNVCPAGFHVPTITDFEILMSFVGSEVYMNGAKLLDNYPWTYGTNETGFSARLASQRNSNGCDSFDKASFMSSEGSMNGDGIMKTSVLEIDGNGYLIMNELSAVEWAAPIRCIKD